MKIKTIAGIMLLMLGMFCVTSCGDDDVLENPQGETPDLTNDEALCEGSWTGWTHLTTNFINKYYTDDTMSLAVAEDGTLTAIFQDATWGKATIKGITAEKAADGSFTLSGGEGSFVMNNIRTGGTEEFACKLESGTLSADKKNLEANISSYMETGHGNMLFEFHSGELPVNIQVAGDWTGWTHLTTNFINKNYTDDTMSLAVAEDGTLTAIFQDATWGKATIKGITAEKAADGSFTLSGGEGSFVMNNIRTGGTEEFACKLESGTLSADKKTLAVNISSYMETGHGNMLFEFHSGEAPAE